jgi:hypothetical protein
MGLDAEYFIAWCLDAIGCKKYSFGIANSWELTYTYFIMGIGAKKIKLSLFPL